MRAGRWCAAVLAAAAAAGCVQRTAGGGRIGVGLVAPMMEPEAGRRGAHDPTVNPIPSTDNPLDERSEREPDDQVETEVTRTLAALLAALAQLRRPMIGVFGTW
jgi:hypothetical protein